MKVIFTITLLLFSIPALTGDFVTLARDTNVVMLNDVTNMSLIDLPLPSINDVGRWLLILVTLGFGLLLLYSKKD